MPIHECELFPRGTVRKNYEADFDAIKTRFLQGMEKEPRPETA